MIYLQVGSYLLVALFLNAFARASYIKHSTRSWFYKADIVYGQNYFMVNFMSLFWPFALIGLFLNILFSRLILPMLHKVTFFVTNPFVNIFLFLMDDERKTKKIQNKKDNTPTTF